MSVKSNLMRIRRSLIATLCLSVLLVPILIWGPSSVHPQGRPQGPPVRRDIPPGPLTPVRTISIDSSYLLCNSLQLQSARRIVWEPLLSSLGASRTERDVYGLALENAATEVCAGRLDSPLMNSAFADLDRVMSGVEDRTFGRTLLTSDERIKLSSALMQAAYDEFQSRCFDNRGKEAELMIDRLPKTPDVGLGVEMQPASAALGRCNSSSGGKAPGTGIDIAFAQSEFQSCAAKVLSNASQNCTDPAGQERSPGTPRPTTEHDTGWQPIRGTSWQQRSHRANAADGTYKDVQQLRNSDNDYTITYQYDAQGHLTEIAYELKHGGTSTKFTLHLSANSARPGAMPRDSGARRRYDAERRRVNDTSQRDSEDRDKAVGVVMGVRLPSSGSPTGRIPAGPAGPTNQCQAMTSSASGAMGLLQPQSSESGEGSRGRELISGTDLVLRCLCALGSKGAQLANQIARATGAPGVSCSNNEWLRRVDCVANPRGAADQIRPECLAYLRADYQFDTPQTACEAAIQCPEDSHPVVIGTPGSSACRCSKGGTAGGPRPGFNCSLVRCPPPGSRSSNPAIQACCGTPAEGPSAPSDGPPRPPGPKPGGPSKSSGDKKDQGQAGAPPSEFLPKLLLVDDLIGRAAVTGGKLQLTTFDSSKGPKDKVLEWSNVTAGDQLTLSVDFKAQASVSLYLSVLRGPQSGSLRVLVNGQELEKQIDLSSPQLTPEKLPLGQFELRAGANTITFITLSAAKGTSKMRVSLVSLSLEK